MDDLITQTLYSAEGVLCKFAVAYARLALLERMSARQRERRKYNIGETVRMVDCRGISSSASFDSVCV